MDYYEIRHCFVDYYRNKNFRLLPKAPMLHPSVPMSFVMSAGLVQVETSLAKINNRLGNKFVLVQDCFRHFDLDSVGLDNTHLSLFEMAAAFVFGKDTREEAINDMWILATKIIGIKSTHLWVSYFKGGELEGQLLPEDKQTYQAWQHLGVPENRLVGLGVADNYWVQRGGGIQSDEVELRKCGPHTELFYDRGTNYACSLSCQPGCRCGRFVEFSNSLFISHYLNPQTNQIELLPEPFIETVMGMERIAMILQRCDSIFEIPSYRAVREGIQGFVTHTNLPPELLRTSENIIVDHLRALCVLINDGAPPPGKNGRERLIKLLIRGIITRQIILGITAKSFLPVMIQLIKRFLAKDTEINVNTEDKMNVYFEMERNKFKGTINRGQREIELMLNNNQGQTLSGSQLVVLEKERGLPYSLIAFTLQNRGLAVLHTDYQTAQLAWKRYSI